MVRSRLKTWLMLSCALLVLPGAYPKLSADDTEDAAGTVYRRLPNYYGQIGISERQRERIYALQAQYNSQIEELEARIDNLKSARDADIEAVLTDTQLRRLEGRREEARLAREARRAGNGG